MNRTSTLFRLGLALALGLALMSPRAVRAEILQDDWAKVMMGGSQIGSFNIQTEKKEENGKAVYVTKEETVFTMQRAGIVLSILDKAETREDENGMVLGFKMERRMGNDLMEVSGKTEGGQLQVVTNGMASTTPYPAGALGSYKIDQEVRKKGFVPGTRTVQTMFNREDPETAVTVTTVMENSEKMKIGEVEKDWLVSSMTMSHMPGMTIKIWGDEKGDFELIRMPLGGLGTIEMQRSSKEEALRETEPPEMFTNSLVKPVGKIPDPGKLKEAVYLLTAPNAQDNAFATGGGQTVESKGKGIYEVRVKMPVPPAAETIFKDAPLPDATYADYLKPSPFIQSKDPLIVAMARQIAGNESNALTLAKRLQQAVYLKITNKNMGTGFASAATVAKTLEGDCTEHAVLAAALGRAMGLPSRVVVGLVYAPPGTDPSVAGNFGYHMWAEVLVAPNVWWPVDGAFGRYDVTHIAMMKSALDKQGLESEMVMPILQVIGDLKIEVVETK